MAATCKEKDFLLAHMDGGIGRGREGGVKAPTLEPVMYERLSAFSGRCWGRMGRRSSNAQGTTFLLLGEVVLYHHGRKMYLSCFLPPPAIVRIS